MVPKTLVACDHIYYTKKHLQKSILILKLILKQKSEVKININLSSVFMWACIYAPENRLGFNKEE